MKPAKSLGASAFVAFLSLTTTTLGGIPDDVRVVDRNAPGPGSNGETWATAFRTLQDALTAASEPQSSITQIWVAASTYTPTDDAQPDPEVSFNLVNGVAIYGGFLGNADPGGGEEDLAEADPLANETILSGDLGTAVNSYHVVRGRPSDEGRAAGGGDAATTPQACAPDQRTSQDQPAWMRRRHYNPSTTPHACSRTSPVNPRRICTTLQQESGAGRHGALHAPYES